MIGAVPDPGPRAVNAWGGFAVSSRWKKDCPEMLTLAQACSARLAPSLEYEDTAHNSSPHKQLDIGGYFVEDESLEVDTVAGGD